MQLCKLPPLRFELVQHLRQIKLEMKPIKELISELFVGK